MITNKILELGTQVGEKLIARRQKLAVAETSAGGLISASLLAMPGASRFYIGGAITYSKRSISGLAGLDIETLMEKGIRSSSEPYAALLAQTIRQQNGGIHWGLSETGAAGPEGNTYGDPAGHTCIAVSGPVQRVRTVRTGESNRQANMAAFAQAALELMLESLETAE